MLVMSIHPIQTQKKILDYQIKELKKYGKDDNVIFDRCPLDNLIYSMWALEKGVGGIDEAFIDKCIPRVCESMRDLDIIFLVPLTDAAPIEIVDDKFRDTDEKYIQEVDNIFKALMARYMHRAFEPFFPEDDVPAIIEIFGSPRERIYLANMYIDADGDAMDGDVDGLIADEVKNLLGEQKGKAATDGDLFIP